LLIERIKAPEGKLEFTTLVPYQGWGSTHLFGGNGAFPFWYSTKPFRPMYQLFFTPMAPEP
jgi:hypothetical protein